MAAFFGFAAGFAALLPDAFGAGFTGARFTDTFTLLILRLGRLLLNRFRRPTGFAKIQSIAVATSSIGAMPSTARSVPLSR